MKALAPSHGTKIDPVTLEVVRNLLIGILDEGEINLSRTAFSPIIYEVKDYCIGLLDREGHTIAQSRGGIPTFMADLGEPVRDGIAICGEDGLHPGDVLLMNYSGICGQHLNNVVIYMPVHWERRLIGFAATRAHWTDVGGGVAGSFSTDTTEIFQEGIQLRSIKIHKRGKVDEELMRVIRHNIRFPDLSFGDMAAQIAACTLSAQRWQEMVGKYTWPIMETCIHAIWDQSEAFRKQISALPDGRYSARSFMDDDGVDFDKTLDVQLAVPTHRSTGQHLAPERLHHRVRINQRVAQHARNPLVAHVGPVGVARQPRCQVHQVGTAHIKHRGRQQRQVGALQSCADPAARA